MVVVNVRARLFIPRSLTPELANLAPANLKATYFAVMASFSNLALSLSQLGAKYLNQALLVAREVRDPATGAIRAVTGGLALGNP